MHCKTYLFSQYISLAKHKKLLTVFASYSNVYESVKSVWCLSNDIWVKNWADKHFVRIASCGFSHYSNQEAFATSPTQCSMPFQIAVAIANVARNRLYEKETR